MKTKTIVYLALLLAIAVVLNYLESLIPTPFVGVKLGLANSVGLIVLYLFGAKYYAGFGLLRVVLTALLWSGFGSAFFISLAGMVLCTIFTLIVYRLKVCSIYGLSVIGAIFHGLGQIIMVAILYQTPYIVTYVLVMTASGLVSGVLMALLGSLLIRRLPSVK
jgi:heptaprenyl diphosphate synthase